ncbi:unnamed protein product [Amoebophrya sp. A120]|nr:unnamed protein product [Amoebophrya sp. A120]|eukprot:GSA120T00016023001.1
MDAVGGRGQDERTQDVDQAADVGREEVTVPGASAQQAVALQHGAEENVHDHGEFVSPEELQINQPGVEDPNPPRNLVNNEEIFLDANNGIFIHHPEGEAEAAQLIEADDPVEDEDEEEDQGEDQEHNDDIRQLHLRFIVYSYFFTVGLFILLVISDPQTYLVEDVLPTHLIAVLSVVFVVSHINGNLLREAFRMLFSRAFFAATCQYYL